MRVEIWKTRTFLFLVGALSFQAGVFSEMDVVWAQSQGECVLPAGATPLSDPHVTAQEVEDGSATLKDFVLAGRDQYRVRSQNPDAASLGSLAYLGCLVRQEGSAYRSGSTYLVLLSPGGRLIWHAKAMRFSGRQLNPLIYRTILSSLGVAATVLADSASPDPRVRARAFEAALRTLSQEPDGPFDATAPVPDVRPGIPGASGYAAAYEAIGLGVPVVLISGFDINESHLVAEEIDYGDPTVTAGDVVDRETLKAFVTQAGNYYLALREEQGGDFLKAKVALRDPNGPWRHGSVYLYVLDRISNSILLHAAFPDRFELRPLVPTVRDDVTGEFILPQVIEAAKSSPEGGFVEYYFDDPADDTDSADIPKLGYAREFTGQIQGADGTVVPVNIIVGSGFYGTRSTALDFAHFANGGSFSSDVVLVNLAATPIQPLVYFYGRDGGLIDPESMVEIAGNLETTDFGALTLQSELPSLGEVTISTNGMGDLVTGSVKVISKDLDSPIGGVLRFDAPGIGVAGVGASQPVRDAIIPVRRQMGGINTGAALRNLSESELTLTCRLMTGGETIEMQPVTLPANGQTAMFISELFEHDTSEFTGSMRCTAPSGAQKFTGVAVELDAMNGIFTTLPVIPLGTDVNSDKEITAEE